MNYLDRLLARAVAEPRTVRSNPIDSPLEMYAVDSPIGEAPASTPRMAVGAMAAVDGRTDPRIPADTMAAPSTLVAPVELASKPAPAAPTPVAPSAATSPAAAPMAVAFDPAEVPVGLPHSAPEAVPAIRPGTVTVVNAESGMPAGNGMPPPRRTVDESLQVADGFMQSLARNRHATPAAALPAAADPTGAAPAAIPIEPALLQAMAQPPPAAPEWTASPRAEPSAAADARSAAPPKPEPAPAVAERTGTAQVLARPPVLINVSAATSIVVSHARRLGASARFGIGQL